ncbi:MAG: hypothetical protein Q8S54_07100 [Bacteroidota bacterium]|nr:hypothetical protein [Bacteroidota bacterium]
MKRLIFMLLALAFITSAANAQQGNFVNKSGSSNIIASINLAITSGAITIPPFNTQSDIDVGLETSAVRFVIKSNKDWKLVTEIGTITANPLAGGAGPATITAPLSYTNIKYYVTPADNFLYSNIVSFPGSIANVRTGVKGNIQKTGNTFNLKFRIIPGYEVDPGVYTIPIIYTLTAQ